MGRAGLVILISFLLLTSMFLVGNGSSANDTTIEQIKAGKLVKKLKAATVDGKFEKLTPFVLDNQSFEWHTCDATDYEELPITFQEIISKLTNHFKNSRILVNESFSIRKDKYFTVETSGWNEKKDNYIYFWAQKTETGWKFFSACYSPVRHLEFIK